MTASTANYSPPLLGTVNRKRFVGFFLGVALLLALYSHVIWGLCRYVTETDYQQHVVLIPFISVFLIWRRYRESKAIPALRSSWRSSIGVALAGILPAILGWKLHTLGAISNNDALALNVLSLLVLLLADGLLMLGWTVIRSHLFAVCFFFFTTPLPDFVVHAISIFLQHTSADAAQFMLVLVGTPVSREGLLFHIHGLDFVVAEECSGIRATFVLFMISLLAGHLLLRLKLYKALLVASVLPIAILRNGFRIALIAWLTAHVDSRVIDSPLHHRGGPLFFLLGLLPFLGLLWWLHRKELNQVSPHKPAN